ncbi:MAG: hypothetical protein HY716_05965 [Planctomycetes bacterium]|nr:hypothetical protein [Planctomycetota bacterium]
MKLTVMVCALGLSASVAAAQQSVTLTSTPDFQRGNNEGLISPALDRLTRERISAGTVGAWSASTVLPSVLWFFSSVAHNGFIYAMGGIVTNFNAYSDVFVAPLNADGTVGAWISTTALPAGDYLHASAVHDGFIYTMGGSDDTVLFGDVVSAPINADGTG